MGAKQLELFVFWMSACIYMYVRMYVHVFVNPKSFELSIPSGL
jgi:hypothetical protein